MPHASCSSGPHTHLTPDYATPTYSCPSLKNSILRSFDIDHALPSTNFQKH
ncbi:hypothetical protein RB213_011730 [Colletotrichum asianum]